MSMPRGLRRCVFVSPSPANFFRCSQGSANGAFCRNGARFWIVLFGMVLAFGTVLAFGMALAFAFWNGARFRNVARCWIVLRNGACLMLSKTVPAFGMALAFGKVLASGTVHTAAASTRQWLDPKRAEHACIGEYAHVTKLSDAHLSRRSETQ